MASITQRKANGKTVYGVRVRRKGQELLTATFERLTDAKAWATRMEAQISENRAVPGSAARRYTVADAIDRYVKSVLPQKKRSTIPSQQGQLRFWRDNIGHYRLADVTPGLLATYKEALSEKYAPATVVRYLAVLSHLFTIVVREWQWLTDNPMRYIKRPKEPKGRTRYLSPDELTRLLSACKNRKDSCLYTLVLLALSTGARKGELLGLRWTDVDLRRGSLSFEETKNDETRSVPLTGSALEQMRQHLKGRRFDTPLVFPNRSGKNAVEVKRAWYSALRAAHIVNFHFHDLRHSASAYLLMSGATLPEVSDVLGHKTLQMVKKYAHIAEQHTASVLNRMTSTYLRQATPGRCEFGVPMPQLIISRWPTTPAEHQQAVRYLQGVMLYPGNAQRRNEFHAAEAVRVVARAEASGPRQTAEALLVALQESGLFLALYRRLFRKGSYDDRGQATLYGAIAGDILLYVIAFEREKYEGSVNRAIYLLQRVYEESKTFAGKTVPANETTLRNAWKNYQSVAHFWGALRVLDTQFFQKESLGQEGEGLPTLPPALLQTYSQDVWGDFPRLIALATQLLQFGLSHTRMHGTKDPLLKPNTVWRCVAPPDLPAVEPRISPLTDLDKQRLADYSELFSHKK